MDLDFFTDKNEQGQKLLYALSLSFSQCNSFAELYKMLHHSLSPLLGIDGIFITYVNEITGETSIVVKAETICTLSPNISLLLQEIITNGEKFRQDASPGIVTSLNSESIANSLFISHFEILVGLFDISMPAVGLWVYKKRGNGVVFDQHEMNILKYLKPIITQAIKVLLFQEEKQRYSQISMHFIEGGIPKAVINNKGTILIGNQCFFQQISEIGNKIFSTSLLKQILKLIQEKSLPVEKENFSHLNYFRVKRRLYEVKIAPVVEHNIDSQRTWLLELKRVSSVNKQLARALKKLKITPRETELIFLLKKGTSYIDIAEQLHLSHYTIRTHVRNIYKKLEISSAQDLVAFIKKFSE